MIYVYLIAIKRSDTENVLDPWQSVKCVAFSFDLAAHKGGVKSMSEKKETEDTRKLVSRRDILAVGGAVIAAGELSLCMPEAAAETITGRAPQVTTAKTSAQVAAKTVEAVVSPLAERAVKMIAEAPRLNTLEGKTIWINQQEFKAPVMMPVIKDLLEKKYPDIKVVIVETSFKAEELIAKGVNGVISGNGG